MNHAGNLWELLEIVKCSHSSEFMTRVIKINFQGRNKYWNIEASEKVIKLSVSQSFCYQLFCHFSPRSGCANTKRDYQSMCVNTENTFLIAKSINTHSQGIIELINTLFFIFPDLSRPGFRKSNHGIAGVLHPSQRRMQVVGWTEKIEGKHWITLNQSLKLVVQIC